MGMLLKARSASVLGECGHASASMLGVTEAADAPSPLQPPPRVANGAVPSLGELARDYRLRADGTVLLYGRPTRVTHPLASYGMQSTPLLPGEACL